MSTCLRKSLDIPFYRYKEMPNCTMGYSYVLMWLAKKRLEPCTCANVAVGEVPSAL
jgi:ubiquinone biosynthesis protein Coq4